MGRTQRHSAGLHAAPCLVQHHAAKVQRDKYQTNYTLLLTRKDLEHDDGCADFRQRSARETLLPDINLDSSLAHK